MSFFDRAGNLLKGFLRKPVQALEEKLERAKGTSPRSVSDSELSALERAREAIAEAEIQAGTTSPKTSPAGAAGAPNASAPKSPAPPEPGKKTPRSMGPDE